MYHTHTPESFTLLLKNKDLDEAYDKIKNITLIGAELTSELNEKTLGIPDNHSLEGIEMFIHVNELS
ncbi:stage II sporulation protein P [Peribacillus frigoritolerans]|uniref:stage II sporulation protein P n=1 Tax=Peribacillus frigoritolerans TaxID=450367 RepID=UPI0039A28F46